MSEPTVRKLAKVLVDQKLIEETTFDGIDVSGKARARRQAWKSVTS